VYQELANLVGQITQVRLGKVLQIGGPADLFKHSASVRRRPGQVPWSDGRGGPGSPRTPTYRRRMRAEEMAEEFPVVTVDSDALEAARMLAEHRLPGLLVTDASGKPYAVLPASQVVRFLLPRYVQDDPSLAGVLNESMADRVADKLGGKTVRDVLPDHLLNIPSADADDTIIEVAAVMAQRRSPLIAVVKDGNLRGVVTASRLIDAALKH
jgi:CBS domain-containing protein